MTKLDDRRDEEKYLKTLYDLYSRKNHQKKPAERFQELKRDVQVLIRTKANINIVQVEDYGGETFLSEELAIKMLQEANAALKRCRLLSSESDLPVNIVKLNDILLRFLMHEHANYALDLGLNIIPIADAGRSFPQLYFFDVVQNQYYNSSLEDQCNTSVVPCIM
ncbi:Exocyst complex component 5 [Eumeta japonica]|uniref:Exocyst complex component 5 n=1 Tax=Eumeta variegata TaxID=151549 RepID=A0A4C1TMV0_EUMVA|nr:Exocyst complex component 5 [Eumeta japonica]